MLPILSLCLLLAALARANGSDPGQCSDDPTVQARCSDSSAFLQSKVNVLSSVSSDVNLAENASMAPDGQAACKPFLNLPPSNCYTAPWVQELLQVDPTPEKVFVDIGCNTGTEAARWLDVWEMTGLLEKWRLALTGKVNEGACGQNTLQNQAVADSFHKPALAKGKVLCVEAMPVNAHLLKSVNAAVFGQSSPMEVIFAAASDSIGTVEFPDTGSGDEVRGINNLLQKVEVPMTTVDKLVADRGISRLDVLTVDTEGHDPAVLRGARQTLQSTRFLQFEVHEDLSTTEWSKTTMLTVLNEVDNAGFDCYWPGNDGSLLKLTGCWTQDRQSAASPIGWSNVVCAKRGDVWHAVLVKHAN